VNVFRQSELTPEELGEFESKLRRQGFREVQVRFDSDLGPRQYRKRNLPGVVGRLLDDSWWTVSWRP
jgi:hypothetical protein